MKKALLASTAVLALSFVLSQAQPAWSTGHGRGSIRLELAGTYRTGKYDEGAAEISAYAWRQKRLFVVNGADETIDILDLSDPTNPTKAGAIAVPTGFSPNSVAYENNLIAIAIEAPVVTDPGKVLFYRPDGTYLGDVTVGALPDMVTFTRNGRYALVANEGEPHDSVNPEGSISIIDVSKGFVPEAVSTAGFSQFTQAELKAKGVRFIDSTATAAQEIEPEYITTSADGKTAWVTLQENNAFATVDIESATVTDVVSFGLKQHGRRGNGIDASDKDDAINIRPWRNVVGMYMPDGIASYQVKGKTYLVTANEGDDRGDDDAANVKELSLDPRAFPDPAIQDNANLGRLTVSKIDGDRNGDGLYTRLFAYGARSLSIWRADGKQMWDSKDALEQITAKAFPEHFNASNTNNTFDNRSDNKGPEPEGVDVGYVGGVPFAFVGLERIGGVVVYDISNPRQPSFVQYINNRNFEADTETAEAGDLGPEGILYIPQNKSPTNVPLLVVANEVSGTTSVYYVRNH